MKGAPVGPGSGAPGAAPPTPTFRRTLGRLERGWPWLAGTALVVAALGAVTWLAADGRLDGLAAVDAADHQLRGYTPFGLFLGVVAALYTLLSLAYSLRKRPLQERLPAGRGSMTTWLWLHVAAGLLALAAAVLHAGYGLLSAELSTGKVLFGIFGLLAASGVAWRVVYQVVPPAAAPRLGDYSELASALRAEEQLTELEKLAAGGSAELHRLKAWLVEAPRSDAEVAAAAASLPPDEQGLLAEVRRLADSRRRALARQRLKASTTRLLQRWRLVHVPLALLLLPAVAVHVVGALDLPVTAVALGGAPSQGLAGVHPSKDCGACHRAITEQWSRSMHAHALRSPLMIAQNNQLVAAELGALPSPDPRRFCVNCHGPVGVALSGRSRLPLARPGYDEALLNEGIGCSTCHQYRGASSPGLAGLTKFQDGLRPGSTYFGELDDPVGNAVHRSAPASIVSRDGALCASCHSVEYDRNGDGLFAKGVDLVLQTTTEEFESYAAEGGKGSCVSCHMPALAGEGRIAERAAPWTEQDREAPPRVVHDHSFVGVDYPLDEVARADPNRPAREALLRGAASLDASAALAKDGKLSIRVSLTNKGAGHNLPSGFAFARQMWLEVRVLDEGKRALFESGLLRRASDDLCDAGTLDDPGNPAKPFVVGCEKQPKGDPQLVSFQQKLVDRVEPERDATGSPRLDARGEQIPVAAAGAKESWLQHLSSGAVARVRPSDRAVLGAIVPGATRTFGYELPVAGHARVTVSVRLLFRSLPPYMIRALGSGQPPGETPALGALVENLQVVEMAARTLAVDAVAR